MHPTHYCTECGALWRQCDDGSWNLRSDKAMPCCDNVPMKEQIKPLAAPSSQEPVAWVKTWHKGGEQHAELWEWEEELQRLPDGYHALYAAPPAAPAQPSEPAA